MDTAGVSSNYAPKRLFVYAPKRLFVHGDLFFRLYLMVSGHSTGMTVDRDIVTRGSSLLDSS